ncbi:NCBP2, RNA recognition motif,RNA recognition motif domain [Cinara cedri]|uniref:Nuclear cap-binding protein subunit 2 n=1 Tax=Cinara cedri TaxID=506608 RepID=A0A5E4MH14_9HEMI|nr:NCBP2, RNA recognition motif,RNA recognition motif domain [Cinara cedri]
MFSNKKESDAVYKPHIRSDSNMPSMNDGSKPTLKVKYIDHKYKGTTSEYKKKLEESTTLYIGNLNLLSTESDVQKLFSKCGKIKTIIMGVEKKTLAPGGFCFVEYETREAAEICIKTLQNYLLYGKKLIIDWDAGFVEGRQYSRNKLSQRPIVYYPL